MFEKEIGIIIIASVEKTGDLYLENSVLNSHMKTWYILVNYFSSLLENGDVKLKKNKKKNSTIFFETKRCENNLL